MAASSPCCSSCRLLEVLGDPQRSTLLQSPTQTPCPTAARTTRSACYTCARHAPSSTPAVACMPPAEAYPGLAWRCCRLAAAEGLVCIGRVC